MEVFQRTILDLKGNLTGFQKYIKSVLEILKALALSPFDGKIYMSNHGARGGDWFGEDFITHKNNLNKNDPKILKTKF